MTQFNAREIVDEARVKGEDPLSSLVFQALGAGQRVLGGHVRYGCLR